MVLDRRSPRRSNTLSSEGGEQAVAPDGCRTGTLVSADRKEESGAWETSVGLP